MLWCEKHVLSMMFNAMCPLKTVTKHFSETKRKCCHTIFLIKGANNKLWVQKVHLNVAEPVDMSKYSARS